MRKMKTGRQRADGREGKKRGWGNVGFGECYQREGACILRPSIIENNIVNIEAASDAQARGNM